MQASMLRNFDYWLVSGNPSLISGCVPAHDAERRLLPPLTGEQQAFLAAKQDMLADRTFAPAYAAEPPPNIAPPPTSLNGPRLGKRKRGGLRVKQRHVLFLSLVR